MRVLKGIAAGMLLLGIAGAGSCTGDKTAAAPEAAAQSTAPAAAPAVPQFTKVYGTVSAIDSTKVVVTLKEAAADGTTTQTIPMTEWSRVVRENEDLTIADVKAGDPVEVVCEIKDGLTEAVMVCLLNA